MSLFTKALNKVFDFTSPAGVTKALPLSHKEVQKRPPKALLWDPMSLMYSLGYKDRRSNVSYDTLRQISGQLSVVGAIINTRVNQVSTFTTPYRRTRNVGFEVKHKDRDRRLTAADKRFITELENFISNCGKPQTNKFSNVPRDNFEQFTRKVIRDRMIYDQMTFEVVPDRKGMPFEFVAVDASTIRIAATADLKNIRYFDKYKDTQNKQFMQEFGSAGMMSFPTAAESIKGDAAYVQVWDGSIVRAYDRDELGFCIANPRTDIRVNGYGYSELEQLVTIITSQLWAEEYNRNFFKQGAAPKGLLNIRGDNIAPEQLEAFRREWVANVSGAENAWRTPIMQSEEIQYVNMQGSNIDMEFSRWLEYLIKSICSCYLIAPEEIGFYLTPGGMQQPMFESNNEWKLKASKDRGLRPLLRFYADALNRNVVDHIDDHFYLDFVGLDELTEKERIELRQNQVQFFRTINEIRQEEDLPPLDDGDIIMNPVYLQKVQMEHAWKVEAQTLKDQKKLQKEQMTMQKQTQKQQLASQKQQMSMQKDQAEQQKKAQEEQEKMQKQQMAAQAQAQQQQESMQQQQVAMQQQQLPPEGGPPPEGGAPPEGAPPEGAPPEGGPPPEGGAPEGAAPAEGAAPEGGPSPEELAQVAAQMGASAEETAAAAKEAGVPEEETVKVVEKIKEGAPEEGKEAAPAEEGKEVTPEELQEFINSLPPETFKSNVRSVEKSIDYLEDDDE